MDAPAAPPTPDPGPASPAVAPSFPHAPVPTSSRSAQVALGVFLVVTLGLLAFRGYGNGLNARPTERGIAVVADLNRADRAELEQVPGIGPTLAREIEDHRRKKGPFQSVEELRQVKGMGPVTLDKVRPFLRIEPTAPPAQSDLASLEPLILERKPTATPPKAGGSGGAKKFQPGDAPIDVNVVGVEELMKLPGIGPTTAQNIIASRAERPIRTLADLDKVKGIGPKKLDAIRPYVLLK